MILHGDCLDKLKELDENSVDCLCCDPPYGINFMGKSWDNFEPGQKDLQKAKDEGYKSGDASTNMKHNHPQYKFEGMNQFFTPIWKEALRVMKPGAFGFICCIPRQDCLSRMMIALEDAGFNINFSSIYWTYATGFPKAMNIGKKIDKKLKKERKVVGKNPLTYQKTCGYEIYRENDDRKLDYSYQQGEITAPVSDLAVKMEGSYAGYQPKPAVEVIIVVMKPLSEGSYINQAMKDGKGVTWFDDCRMTEGRFPANLLVQDDIIPDVTKFFDLDDWAQRNLPFIIVPKANKKEKNAGLEKNNHPTVKPMKLMSYLITLGSREGDVILDCFGGSGTTACSAIMLRRNFITIEKEDEYIKIIEARVKHYSDIIKTKPLTV